MLLPSALFELKTNQIHLRTPDPTSGVYSVPLTPYSWFRAGHLRQEREWRGEQGGKEEKERGWKKKRAFPYFFFYNLTTEHIEDHQVHSDITSWPQTR